MLRPTTICFFILVVLSFSKPILAEKADTRVYLPTASVEDEKLIGQPPSIDSATFSEQMAIVLWLQKTRTPEQVAFVKKSLNLARFDPVIGDSLNSVDKKELRDTLAVIISEVRTDHNVLKAKYGYPRPFVVNEEVKPVIKTRSKGSYPSGTSTRSVVYARILGVIFPEKKDELMELALQIGYGRAIAGVHYPVDVLAGQKLGNAYADIIIKQSAFKEAVSRIRGD